MPRAFHSVLLRLYRRLPARVRRAVVHGLAPSYTVGAICVVERPDGQVLLVRHSYRQHWGFPGGLLRRREDVADGARREVQEEVDLLVDLLGEPAVVVTPGPRRVDVIFRARPSDGADPDALRAASPEILEVRWFPADALPELQHEAADALVALARVSGAHVRPG